MADIKQESFHQEEDQGGPIVKSQTGHHQHELHRDDIEEENEDLILDIGAAKLEGGDMSNIKLAKNGHTVLIPQPTGDPNDPLNWSWRKKHTMLGIVALTAFLGDYGSAAGVPCIVVQGMEWGMSPSAVNDAGNLNVIML
ncbi:MAG: hypothetical protein M1827_006258 [Pycnora praestabilis]|nr:MAG: hypothetical protein M1827_006258 [Pycnora praestabilis]